MFAKEPASAEIINDLNSELINFYWCSKMYYSDLKKGNRQNCTCKRSACSCSTYQRTPSILLTGAESMGCMDSFQDVFCKYA